MAECIVDITELLRNPMRTGIQRVVRELLRYWPDEPLLRLARFDQTRGLVPVPRDVVPILLESKVEAAEASLEELSSMLASALTARVRRLPRFAPILIPEVCHNHPRWAWYEALRMRDPRRFSMIVFDFIPWLHERLYSLGPDPMVAPYFELVTRTERLCFISDATRDEALSCIGRAPDMSGPVFAPGADGLQLERQNFDTSRNTWVVVGSVCRNKGHDLVLAAFEQLWRDGFDGRLIFLGRDADGDLTTLLTAAKSYPLFYHVLHPSDQVLREALQRARATIAVSHVEGYGLAPIESLHAGIPTIVTAGMPSVRHLPPHGQIRIDKPSVESIASAVRELADPATARRLWAEAALLDLPTWRNFAAEIAGWMTSEVSAEKRKRVLASPAWLSRLWSSTHRVRRLHTSGYASM